MAVGLLHPVSLVLKGATPGPRNLFVCWLLNVPATCECISGTDLLRQFYVLGPRKQARAGQGLMNISVITETGESWEGRCAGVCSRAEQPETV